MGAAAALATSSVGTPLVNLAVHLFLPRRLQASLDTHQSRGDHCIFQGLMWINATAFGFVVLWSRPQEGQVGNPRRCREQALVSPPISPSDPRPMMSFDFKSGGSRCAADPLVFSQEQDESTHAEILSVCERLAKIWKQRALIESDLWLRLKQDLANTSNASEALGVYSENVSARMRLTLENAERLFDEQLRIAQRFARQTNRGGPESHSSLGR
jgi:hypothetical protein